MFIVGNRRKALLFPLLSSPTKAHPLPTLGFPHPP